MIVPTFVGDDVVTGGTYELDGDDPDISFNPAEEETLPYAFYYASNKVGVRDSCESRAALGQNF